MKAIRVSHYLNPVSFELERDVTLFIDEGRVVEVRGHDCDLPHEHLVYDAAIAMPGFVNSHTHLDLSHMHRQIPLGLSFLEWVPAIAAGRKMDKTFIANAMDDAIRQCVSHGTTSIIDISVDGGSAPMLARHGLSGVVALELLEIRGDTMNGVDEVIREHFELDRRRLGEDAGKETDPSAHAEVDFGYSPHAPYSVSMEGFQDAFGRAVGEGRVCAPHVAETREELEYVMNGQGPFRDVFEKAGIDQSNVNGHNSTPFELLLDQWLMPWLKDENPQLLLVHANYACESDFELLGATKPSVCWCPRSHQYFSHEKWPLEAITETGANLTLGTDSLASNDGIDMLGEIRSAHVEHPDYKVSELFRAATLNGRRVLGFSDDRADVAVWGIPAGSEGADLEDLLKAMLSGTSLYASLSNGQLIARAI
ncbi:MAG: amidohydrolase family protein [Planctomycetota bacterium]|jgi:cytosine/adenosine deaminase-related metal-dependent hydrolase